MSHVFDASIALEPAGEHRWAGATHPAYANMVGPFGGTTCAVLLNAALQHAERLGDPIALTVNYAGPIADGAFTIDARPVRTNRSTQHWTLALAQNDQVCATATAVFAQRRDTWSVTEAQPPADMPPAASLPRAPVKGAPPWVHSYDMRWPPAPCPRPSTPWSSRIR